MIRSVKSEDVPVLFHSYQVSCLELSRIDDFDYLSVIQKVGFVIPGETQADFEKQAHDNRFFFLYEKDGRVVGFIRGASDKEFKDDENKTWFDLQMKDFYYHDNASYSVDLLIIDHSFHGIGIGSELLRHFEEQLRQNGYKYLFSTVRYLPVTNCASIIFHARNKFKRVAVGKPVDRDEIKNSGLFLYFKELQ